MSRPCRVGLSGQKISLVSILVENVGLDYSDKMCSKLTLIAVLVFCLVIHCGQALFECSVPPNSSLIYLDLVNQT